MKPGRATEPDNEKNQVCGLRARAKGLLADFAPPRKGGGDAAGIRYVAKTGKVLFRLIPRNLVDRALAGGCHQPASLFAR